jgi:excisionase family DNA binding protein
METDLLWMTKEEAAEYLRVTPQTVDGYRRKGLITCFKLGGFGKPRFSRKDLDKQMKREVVYAQ